MNTAASTQVRGLEKCVWLLDETPLDLVHRAGLGALMVPAYEALLGRNSGLWTFICLFFAALFVMKMGMGVVRRFFPASSELKTAWRDRRMLGKAYDSYQWRKLAGYGAGMLAYLLWSGRGQSSATLFAGGCILAGIVGTICWHRRRASFVVSPPAVA